MRFFAAVLAVTVAATAFVRASQDEKKATPKGSAVVVVGCLAGATLRVIGDRMPDAIFALRGSKERLRAIRKEFDGQKVEVVGFTHDTPGTTTRGKVVTSGNGKTRFSVNAREDVGLPAPTPLDVESVKLAGGKCH